MILSNADMLLEWSLFFRAVMYAFLFIGIGVITLRTEYVLPKFAKIVAWLSIAVGIFNIVMAIEWLFYYFI